MGSIQSTGLGALAASLLGSIGSQSLPPPFPFPEDLYVDG